MFYITKVHLPECKSNKKALSTVEKFVTQIDDYLSRTSEFGCPIPCKQKSFKHKLEYFSKNTFIEFNDEQRIDQDSFELIVFFKTMDIEEKTETFVYDVGNFLTAAGGNLGLFMGFSCLSIILTFIDKFEHHFG